jgi:starch synthase (maltosyl-transferring)
MNFDWVLLGSSRPPDAFGDVYAVRDPDALHPIAAGASSKSADELLRGLADATRAQGLQLMMDLEIYQSASDAPLVSEHPDWFRNDASPADGAPIGGSVVADFEARDARAGLTAYWQQYLRHCLQLGVRGFRCRGASRIPAGVWAGLLGAARVAAGETMFVADTLGCTPDEVGDLAEAGFDYVLNSARWWDFHSPWLLEQYEAQRRFIPSIAFPESLASGSLSAEVTVDAPDELARHYRLRYLFAALFSAGVMMPMGYEFGFSRRVEPASADPKVRETPRFDISTFVAETNALKADCPALHTEGPQRRLDAPFGAPVCILQLSGETGELGCALLLINPSDEHPAGVDPAVLLAQIQGTYDSYTEVRPARHPEALQVGEHLVVEPLGMRVFRGDYAAALDHVAGLTGVAPSDDIIRSVIGADYEDPFAVRGMHAAGPGHTLVVRAFVPGADAVEVIHAGNGKAVAALKRLHPDGFFAGTVGGRTRPFKYRLRILENGHSYEAEDPYRF